MQPIQLAFFPNFSGWELLVILVIGLLLFGSRLPQVGRNLGKSIIEFKKGIKGVEEEINNAANGEKQYRAPLAEGGQDRRVSKADSVETPAPAQHSNG